MISKNAKTILFAALIAAMILPFSGMQSAEAHSHGESFTIVQLQKIIDDANTQLALYEVLVINAGEIYDYRVVLIIAHQAIVDALDAIVNSGGKLTDDQLKLYYTNVGEIISLEAKNVITESEIREYFIGIALYQDTIIWAQAEIDSRV